MPLHSQKLPWPAGLDAARADQNAFQRATKFRITLAWIFPMTSALPDIDLSEELIRKFDKPGPRYTAYPTADR